MGSQKDVLNYDFKWRMFKAKSFLSSLNNPEDKDRILAWLEKLADLRLDIQEMKTRNELMQTLLSQLSEGKFNPPFTEDPPPGPLSPSASSMLNPTPKVTTAGQNHPEKGPKPFINQFSPDGGSFLTAQPVPRCGAFCYLAVTSRERNNN